MQARRLYILFDFHKSKDEIDAKTVSGALSNNNAPGLFCFPNDSVSSFTTETLRPMENRP